MHPNLGDDGQHDEHAHLGQQVRGDLPRVVQRGQHVASDAHEQGQPHEGQLQEAARPGRRDRYGGHYEAPPLCAPDCFVPDWEEPDWFAPDWGFEDEASAMERLSPSI